MAGLFRDSEHEEYHEKLGRVAETQTPGVHLETMEGAESEDTKPYEIRHT